MAQFDFGTIDPFVIGGVTLTSWLNQWRDAIHSMHRGPGRPAYAVSGMMWINDTGGPADWLINIYLGPGVGDRTLWHLDTTTDALTFAGGTVDGDLIVNGTLQALTAPPAADDSDRVPTTAWVRANASSSRTGDVVWTYRTVADPGWIVADDGTIGDGASGATTRANADCLSLFNLFWPNANCAIAGGKGASAAADWGAHKALAIPKTLGRVLGVAGAAGAGLTARGVADIVGEEKHLLTIAEMPSHQHSVNAVGNNPFASPVTGSSLGGTAPPTGNTGGDTPHNIMQPSAFLKLHIKL